MSGDEIRVTIAEKCGLGERVKLEKQWDKGTVHYTSSIPNFPNDLNACHEFEKTLSYDQWRIFLGFLMGERTIPKLASMQEFHRAWHATARQRCEAFLRTFGLWKDNEKEAK